MHKTLIQKTTILVCGAAFCLLGARSSLGQDLFRSPVDLAVRGTAVWVVDATAKELSLFDAKGETPSERHALPKSPSGLALAPNGKTVYVTAGGSAGVVYVIEREKGIVATWPVGHTPVAPVLLEDGATLAVCNRFENALVLLDIATGTPRSRVGLSREPVAAALVPGRNKLVIANLLPSGAANAGYSAALVEIIDTQSAQKIAEISLPNGSNAAQGVAVSPDGRYAYVSHVLARYQLPTTQIERGWINTNAVSVIDLENNALLNTFLLDDVDLGAANPWGIVCSEEGKWLCVAQAGTHEISVIDREALHAKLDAVAQEGKADTVPNQLSFLLDVRERVRLTGKGPRAVAAHRGKLYAANYFSGTIETLDLGEGAIKATPLLAVGAQPEDTPERAGELFFNDATNCFQQWHSCATCHPGGARMDGLNWDLLNDGIGNPKNTKSMLLSHETPPAMITGIRDSAEVAVRAGIRYIYFNTLPDKYAQTVDAYLKSLTPVPSPALVDGDLSAAARRGAVVFELAQCNLCHKRPNFIDGQTHDVGTGTGREAGIAFDTPTLRECWRTAPYLYDGRAPDLRAVLKEFNADDKHGLTSGLSESDIADLIEYIESL